MAFDPNAYLNESSSSGGFDPNAYLNETPKSQSMYERAATKVSPAATPSTKIERTIPGVAKQLVDFINPFPTSPTTNPAKMFDEKRQFLDSAGGAIKRASTESLGNQVEKGMNPYVAAAADTALSVLPFSPMEFGAQAAGELAPVIAGEVTKPIGKDIANRYVNAPKPIREGRLMSGEATVGEDVLNTPEAMKGAKSTFGSKKKAFDNVMGLANKIGQKVNTFIDNINISGKMETPDAPVKISQDLTTVPNAPKYSVPKQEILEPAYRYANTLKGAEKQSLLKYLDEWSADVPDILDFKNMNTERIGLGQDIGKGFDKLTPELSNKTTAQRIIWQKLRGKIGEYSPEIDNLLGEQHKLIDIANSLKSEASKGYGEIPSKAADVLTLGIPKNMTLANTLYNSIPNARGVGSIAQGMTRTPDKSYLAQKLQELEAKK